MALSPLGGRSRESATVDKAVNLSTDFYFRGSDGQDHSIDLLLKVCLDHLYSRADRIYAASQHGDPTHSNMRSYFFRLNGMGVDPLSEADAPFVITNSLSLRGQSDSAGEAVELSKALERLTNQVRGVDAINGWKRIRQELIDSLGSEGLLMLEQILGVDSRGVEADDLKPFLGIDRKKVASGLPYLLYRGSGVTIGSN